MNGSFYIAAGLDADAASLTVPALAQCLIHRRYVKLFELHIQHRFP